MEYLSEIFNLYSLSYTLLAVSPCIYPYIVKGDIPYKHEEHPDAAVILAGIEGILLSGGIGAILSVLWFKIDNIPLDIGALWVPGIVILGLRFHLPDRVTYGTRVTWQGVMSYARRRYSWIINRIAK